MILRRSVILPVLVLFILFTAMFVSLVSIYEMPERMMGSKGTYVLTSSTDKNPIRSNLDIRIAYGLQNMSYITAVSPEIFVFTTMNGRAVTVRGVIFKDFLSIERGKIIAGALPNSTAEAMVGYRIANSMGLKVGDNITLRGSFQASVAVVRVAGIFDTNDPADDEILVSLPTARTLAGIAPGKVSIIRIRTNNVAKVNELMSPTYPKFTVSVNTTSQLYLGSKLLVNATVKNMGTSPGWANLTFSIDNHTWSNNIYVRSEKTVHVALNVTRNGTFRLTTVVKNDIFYYTYYTEISVLKRPASIQGTTFAYTDRPVSYSLLSVNNTPVNGGVLTLYGPNSFIKNYTVSNGTAVVTFPVPGSYYISYSSKYYTPANITVNAYKLTALSNLTNICPAPINGTIYAEVGTWVNFTTAGIVHYSIDDRPLINATSVPVPDTPGKAHTLNVIATLGNKMGNATYTLIPVASTPPEIVAPVKNGSRVNYMENLTFTLKDNVPLSTVRYSVNGAWKTIVLNQTFNPETENYTYNLTLQVQSYKFDVSIIGTDTWHRSVNFQAQCNVLINKDIIKPQIFAPATVKIWGGNRTEVTATDNVELALLSVHFYNHYFNSTSGTVFIKTVFNEGGALTYVPPGTYNASIMAQDTSGNVNRTNITIIIDNNGEKNPPTIIGPHFVNLSSGSVTFKAYDNVGVQSIALYNGSTLIKNVIGSTLVLNSSELANGSYHLEIIATDVNGNPGYFYFTLVKNYTDTVPPSVFITATKIWSGNTTWVFATDNILMQSLTVQVFGKTLTGTSRVTIATKWVSDGKINYIAPGIYPVSVTARDIYGNTNEENFTLIINNTNEKSPPEFLLPEFAQYNATAQIAIPAFDNVGVKSMWLTANNNTIANATGSWLNFSASLLSCGYTKVTVYAEDFNNNTAYHDMTVNVVDNIRPRVLNTFAEIWGGNTTVIHGWDNVRVASMSVNLFGHKFQSENGTLLIPTEFTYGSEVHYVPSGKYVGTVHIRDSSGNENSTGFTLVINNKGEKIPPVITGPRVGAINVTTYVNYIAYDNVKVAKMWVLWNGTKIAQNSGAVVTVKYGTLPAGPNQVYVYAEDVNGNTAVMNSTIVVAGVKRVDMQATLEKSNITVNERTTVTVTMSNQDMSTTYSVTIEVDGSTYYQTSVHLAPYEKKSLYVVLPYLDKGTHTIRVNNDTLLLKVEPVPASKLPTDIILKYAKGLKFTESKSVIYKGFQISEGNFILVLASLLAVTLILVFLGLYSTAMKGLKNENIGVLRAIGASNRQIFMFFMKESWKYVLIPGLAGIVGGYALVLGINSMNMLTAFGHHLTIVPTVRDIAAVLVLTFIFIFASLFIIYKKLMDSRVTHIMGRAGSHREVPLDELLRENS